MNLYQTSKSEKSRKVPQMQGIIMVNKELKVYWDNNSKPTSILSGQMITIKACNKPTLNLETLNLESIIPTSIFYSQIK